MIRFLFWRFVQSIIVLWAVYTITFYMLMMTPGDPFVSGEKKPPPAVLKALADKYGLGYLTLPNRATLTAAQKFRYVNNAYVRYLGLLLQGDLGPSIDYENWAVRDIVAAALPVSVSLGSLSLLIALWVGVAFGMFGATREKSTL